MDSADFMKILIAQLQQQDPMNPMSNEAMVQQMATIRDMEMSYTLTETLQQMTSEQRFAGAAGLIGKYVEGVVTDAEGEEMALTGVVTGVRFTESGKAILELDTGASLPLEKLTQVHAEAPDGNQEVSSVRGDLASKAGPQGRGASVPPPGNLATFGMTGADGLGLRLTLG
jgi:flagellar basal-body rod modification protein FlgD